MGEIAGRPLRFFNTLGRRQEPFTPLSGDKARVYTCGPTVYAYPHIGNLRAYVFSDVLRRALEWKGYDVDHVMNVTDVGHLTSDLDEGEDKLEVASRKEQRSIWEIAAHYTDAFLKDLDDLRILSPTRLVKATDHIPHMIRFAERLHERGFTYEIESGLFFDTSKVADYGKLAKLDVEHLLEGARVAPVPGKRRHTDFAVWRKSPEDSHRLMEWPSPWGTGAPGWHLECSVMSIEYLGDHFDVHTGGIDHIPVHHTNEIAQSEAYVGDGQDWVRYWLHCDFLVEQTGKMSKSAGKFLRLTDLVEAGFHPAVYRYLLLSSHYRKKLEFSFDALGAARIGLRRLVQRLDVSAHPGGGLDDERTQRHLDAFAAAIEDDLNTPEAVAALMGLSRDDDLPAEQRVAAALDMDEVLGLGLAELSVEDLELRSEASIEESEILRLIEERAEARRGRDFARADAIRSQLEEAGVQLHDVGAETTWTYA